MITVEKRNNAEKNYLRLWCATCMRQLELIDYGLKEVAPAGIQLIESMANRHETRNHEHQIFILEGSRLPTNSEIREG